MPLSVRNQPARPRPARRRFSCLTLLLLLGVAVLLLVQIYLIWGRPALSRQVGQTIGDRFGLESLPPGTDTVSVPIVGDLPIIPPEVISAILSAAVSGELRVTDEQINRFLAANSAMLAPAEQVRVQFVPGEVRATFRLFGNDATLFFGLAVTDGRVRLINPRTNGPLDMLFSVEDAIGPLEEQINTQLAAYGQRLRAVQIGQGTLVLDIE